MVPCGRVAISNLQPLAGSTAVVDFPRRNHGAGPCDCCLFVVVVYRDNVQRFHQFGTVGNTSSSARLNNACWNISHATV